MLLSSPSKIFCRIILDRIQSALDSQLRKEQAGFRQDKSCTDQIATLRIIIEQCVEWQTPLYVNFVDFEKAFDSLDREVLWKLLGQYGLPSKIISLIKNMYQDFSGRVISKGNLSNTFAITTGVRQGCLLSPLIFLIAIDWIMRRTTKDQRTGIQWTLLTQLEDLDFADDLALVSENHTHMQQKTDRLQTNSEQLGLKINTGKTKTMRLNPSKQDPITLRGETIEDVEHFTYLGSNISRDGGADRDIEFRIGKAQLAFRILRPIWLSKQLSNNTKLRIFNTNVKTVLLYGSETWKTTEGLTSKLQVFVNKCLRYILKLWWPIKTTNEELWRITKQDNVAATIKKRKWNWIGHTLRKDSDNITRQALDYNPQGKRKQGRPRNTWRRSTLQDLKNIGVSWQEAKALAQKRVRWRALVDALWPLMG